MPRDGLRLALGESVDPFRHERKLGLAPEAVDLRPRGVGRAVFGARLGRRLDERAGQTELAGLGQRESALHDEVGPAGEAGDLAREQRIGRRLETGRIAVVPAAVASPDIAESWIG